MNVSKNSKKKRTKAQILADVRSHAGSKVRLAIADVDGILRGKTVHVDKFLSAVEGGVGVCNIVFGWDCADVPYSHDETHYTGWHTGYPDALARIDLDTYRRVPWDGDIPFFLADFEDSKGKPLSLCPRVLLKKIRDQASGMGFFPLFSQEFEWFNFIETNEGLNARGFHKPRTMSEGMCGFSILRASQHGDFFNDLFDQMTRFGIPLEGAHTETGPGVYEAAILCDEILESADRAVLFKTGFKEVCFKRGIMPSFMAKWNAALPGCSGHVHQSLWDPGRKKNLFHDNGAGPLRMSKLMQQYLAGQLHCLPHILPFYAPTVNSYKRLTEGAWAPNTVTWGVDNRTTAVRALLGTSSTQMRIEMRVPGSDVNPYLAMAASLASGLYGIRHKLKLDIPMTTGNGYADKRHGKLAVHLGEAVDLMRRSEIAEELFGKEFADHFARTRDWEWGQFTNAVTDWELKRYFELI